MSTPLTDLAAKALRLRGDNPPDAEAIRRLQKIEADAVRAVVEAAQAGRLPEDLAKLARPPRRNRLADDAAWASVWLPLAVALRRGVFGDAAVEVIHDPDGPGGDGVTFFGFHPPRWRARLDDDVDLLKHLAALAGEGAALQAPAPPPAKPGQGPRPKAAPAKAQPAHRQSDAETEAIGILAKKQPDWSIKQWAAHLDVNRTTVYKWPTFMQAWTRLKHEHAKGRKAGLSTLADED